MASVTTLGRVNEPAAQTWNYLKTNGVDVAVPTRGGYNDIPFPTWANNAKPALGAEAEQWLRDHADDVRVIDIPAGTDLVEPIVLRVSAASSAISCTSVRLRAQANATIVLVAAADHEATRAVAAQAPDDAEAVATAGNSGEVATAAVSEAPATCGSLLRVVAEEGSQLRVHDLTALDSSYQYLNALGVFAGRDASVEIEQYVLDAGNALLGCGVELAGDRSRLDLGLHYIVREGEALDVNYTVRQRGKNTQCNIDAYGVLSEGARKTLRDTIDFVRGSAGSKGREQETVLLAGERLVNKSLPTILCAEEDMQGDHGATIGAVSPEQLAYLSQRGLSSDDITALFSRSVIDGALTLFSDAGHDAALRVARRALGDDVEECIG